MTKGSINGSYITYQGKPLIRQDNAYVWGDMKDRAVLFLLVLNNKTVNGHEVPDNILIQVLSTDESHTCLKQGQKSGLFDALDIGTVWLKKELGE
ncbi:MAG: hypothetical protein J6I50_08060 [Clostridia bacterium]|nr:hypothetical protein [Clostridia bacterium]